MIKVPFGVSCVWEGNLCHGMGAVEMTPDPNYNPQVLSAP